MTRPALLFLAFSTLLCAQFRPDDSTRVSFQVPAFSRIGERKIQGRDVLVDTFSKAGQPIKRNLSVVFDPISGYFLFSYEGLGDLSGHVEEDRRYLPTDEQRKEVRYAAYVT